MNEPTPNRHGADEDKITWIAPADPWPSQVRAGLSCRSGGVSPRPFGSLNFGSRTGDLPANLRRNLDLLNRTTGLDLAAAARIRLRHEAKVRLAGTGGFKGDADALVTKQDDLVLGLTVADCVPVVLAHPTEGLALIHCGWRSVVGGIVGRSMERLLTLGSAEASDHWAWIGPGIGPCCFEVGPEVVAQFATEHHRAPAGTGRPRRVDLPGSIRSQLLDCGFGEGRIQCSELCTVCRPDLFYSHRRDAGRTGRMLAWAVRRSGL